MIRKRGNFPGDSKKTVSTGAEMMVDSRLFQRWLPATGNA